MYDSALEPYFGSTTHRWHDRNILEFESRLPDHPQTIQLRISSSPLKPAGIGEGENNEENGTGKTTEIGYAFVDISECWNPGIPKKTTHSMDILSYHDQKDFDQSGFLEEDPILAPEVCSKRKRMKGFRTFLYRDTNSYYFVPP